jgi:cobalt-zinc-cadmium efflux system membrane fusion protein
MTARQAHFSVRSGVFFNARCIPFLMLIGALGTLPVAHAAPGAHGPNGEHLAAPGAGATASNGAALARLPDGSIQASKQAQRRMTIRTVMTQQAQHALTVQLNGRVAIDPNAGGRVQAPFAGRIEAGTKGLPVLGQRVTKGQVLVHLNPVSGAIEQANQQAQLADLRANRALAEQRVARLEQLAGSVPAKESEAAKADLISLRGRERAVSGSLANRHPIVASASGVIAAAHVLVGQIAAPRDILFEIVDPDRMIIEALTPDATLAGRMDNNGASLLGFPKVKLIAAGAGRSLQDGALPLNFQARGKALPLAIGQPVTVVLKLTEKINGVALPAAALVRGQNNETIVWIKAGAERFIAQPVQIQVLDTDTVVVTQGLAADNRVVVSGAALINQIR